MTKIYAAFSRLGTHYWCENVKTIRATQLEAVCVHPCECWINIGASSNKRGGVTNIDHLSN